MLPWLDIPFFRVSRTVSSIRVPPAKLLIGADELKLLVFPDSVTRRQALQDEWITGWLPKEPSERPLMPTIEECSHF